MKKPLRWRRGKGVRYGPNVYELVRDGKVLARAQEVRPSGLWFWYGFGRNTAGNEKSLDDVKREAREHVLANEE